MISLPEDYHDTEPVDVSATATRWLTYLIFATSLAIYYLLPILAGIFTETFGFSSRQTGMLLSADMTANTIAAFSARYWIHRCYWRRVFPFAVLLTVIPNLLCGMAESFEALLAYRYMAGLGAGTMVAFMYATISASVNPDREFAYAMALQVFVGALCLNGASWLWMTWGAAPVFIMTGLVALLPVICYHAIPRSNPLTGNTRSDKQLSKPSAVTDRTVLYGLLAVGLFFASMNSIWSFMERLGDAEGFATDFIAITLSVSLLFSFAGALVPAWLAGRMKRIVPISFGYVWLFIAIYTVGQHPAAIAYFVALCVYNFFYSFVIPFQNGWIASFDRDGRTVVLLPFMQGIGIAAGPVLAGLVIVDNQYANVIYISLFLLSFSYMLFAGMYRQSRIRRADPGAGKPR